MACFAPDDVFNLSDNSEEIRMDAYFESDEYFDEQLEYYWERLKEDFEQECILRLEHVELELEYEFHKNADDAQIETQVADLKRCCREESTDELPTKRLKQ